MKDFFVSAFYLKNGADVSTASLKVYGPYTKYGAEQVRADLRAELAEAGQGVAVVKVCSPLEY